MPLKPKQLLFVKAYLANGQNATQAAKAAGYKGNDATLSAVGHENLRKPEIKTLVQNALAKRAKSLEAKAEALGITQEGVLRRMASRANARITDFAEVTDEGLRVKPTAEWDPNAVRAVKKLIPGKGGAIGIELHSPAQADEQICKLLGWQRETLELTGKDGGPIQTQEIKLTKEERAAELERLRKLREDAGED